MCEAWDEMKKDCKAEGKEEGHQEKAAEIAKSMLQAGKLANEDISEYSGLPLDTVLALAQEMRSA